jgi:hypothetical protein
MTAPSHGLPRLWYTASANGPAGSEAGLASTPLVQGGPCSMPPYSPLPHFALGDAG